MPPANFRVPRHLLALLACRPKIVIRCTTESHVIARIEPRANVRELAPPPHDQSVGGLYGVKKPPIRRRAKMR